MKGITDLKEFFAYDGKVMGVVQKIGEVILLNLMFLLTSIPIVTIGPSCTSFYYAMIKSVRRDCGSPVQEYLASFKRTWKKGCVLTLFILVWVFGLAYGWMTAGDHASNTIAVIYLVLLAVTVGILVYLFPVFSRFEMKLIEILKLSFVMCIRHLPVTLLLVAGSALLVWLLIYIVPMPCVLVLPGVWCLAATFPMEWVLRKYMPHEENEDAWYYGKRKEVNDEKK